MRFRFLSRGYGLFFVPEVVDERKDETSDRADELHPIFNIIHTRHPPSFEEESRRIELPNALNTAQSHKFFKQKSLP